MITVYGIKNCDTMKKAFGWLEANGIEYTFVDYKRPASPLNTYPTGSIGPVGKKLLNTRGLMWKKLTEEERADMNQTKAHKVMETYPSIIKRPVLDTGKKLLVGFDPEVYAKTLL